jgi:hypothetical protein
MQTSLRGVRYVTSGVEFLIGANSAIKAQSCIMGVVVTQILIAGIEKRTSVMPCLMKNGYSLIDNSVDIREGYSGELQIL